GAHGFFYSFPFDVSSLFNSPYNAVLVKITPEVFFPHAINTCAPLSIHLSHQNPSLSYSLSKLNFTFFLVIPIFLPVKDGKSRILITCSVSNIPDHSQAALYFFSAIFIVSGLIPLQTKFLSPLI